MPQEATRYAEWPLLTPNIERPKLLRFIALAAVSLLAALPLACGGSASGSDDATSTAAAVMTATAAPTSTPEPPDLTIFRNFAWPIAGACLPASDDLMPNAPREYRGGVHEGVDFYGLDNCVAIEKDAPVLAAKDGVVLRADFDYHDLTQEELAAANARIANGEPNAFEVLDLFRGRQVWIDHGKGIVTRYAHLEGIAPDLRVGARVAQGQTIAFVGDSGTPESLSAPDTEIHLHFELRAGDGYLSQGLPPEETRALYELVFTPLP